MRHYVPHRCRTVVTKAGIVIGGAYVPPAPRPSADHERIQAALLDSRTERPLTGWRRALGFLWRHA